VRVAIVLALVVGAVLFLVVTHPAATKKSTANTTTTTIAAATALQNTATAALGQAATQSFCQNITSISSSLAAPTPAVSSNATEATVATDDLDYATMFTTAGEYAVYAAEYAPTQDIGQHVAALASGLGAVSTTLLATHNDLLDHPSETVKQYSTSQDTAAKAMLTFLNTTIYKDLHPVSSFIKAGCASAAATTTTTPAK
jgi:hypothetical protein